MTAPFNPETFPGIIRTATLGDVTGLVTHHSTHHIGFPPGVSADFPAEVFPTPRLTPAVKKLRPGDVYLFSADSLASHLLGVPGFVPNLVEDLLLLLERVAAAEALNVAGFIPIAWTVPDPKEPNVPTPGHIRMTFSGVFGTAAAPLEIWSWGINAAPNPGRADQAALDAASAGMFAAYETNIKQVMSNRVVLTQCLYARVNPDGHIARNGDGSFQQSKHLEASVGGQTGAGTLPLQTALVASYGTARPGASGRGRSFLPFQDANSLDPDFRVSDATTQTFATRVGHLVFQLNQLGSACVVASSLGFLSPITTVRVGKVPDTMRSRRDKLTEGYIAGSISAP